MGFKSKDFLTKLSVAATVGGAAAALIYYALSRRRPLRFNKENILKNINVVNTKEDWDHFRPYVIRHLKSWPLLGMDCEWITKAGRRNPVALLQLATPHGLCLLIRNKVLKDVPASLSELLADRSILKVGVAVVSDGNLLMQDYGIDVSGCVDLRSMVNNPPDGIVMQKPKSLGLASLSEVFVGLTLNKGARRSNWEAKTLSESQVKYAAMDALAAVLIFEEVTRIQLRSSNWSFICNSYESFIDIPYNTKRKPSDNPDPPDELVTVSNSQPATNSQPLVIPKRKMHKSAHPTRKKPLYYNCETLAPDGQLLNMCSPTKAQWYLDKKFAVKKSDDPLIVQLTIEPRGRPELDNSYYTLMKENVCVICGKKNSYLKKKIVPHEYRRHFPSIMKDRQSHDVLLLCPSCHTRSERSSRHLRKILAEECNAPLMTANDGEPVTWQLNKVKSTARALQNSEGIPKERIEVLESRLKRFLGKDDITEEDIEQLVSVPKQRCSPEPPCATHGFLVVQHYAKNGGLVKLARRWRENFVISMQPKHLPEQWSIDHNHERLKVHFERLQGTGTPTWDYVIALDGLDTVNPHLYLKENGKICERLQGQGVESDEIATVDHAEELSAEWTRCIDGKQWNADCQEWNGDEEE